VSTINTWYIFTTKNGFLDGRCNFIRLSTGHPGHFFRPKALYDVEDLLFSPSSPWLSKGVTENSRHHSHIVR
jgi:hypothetical protein